MEQTYILEMQKEKALHKELYLCFDDNKFNLDSSPPNIAYKNHDNFFEFEFQYNFKDVIIKFPMELYTRIHTVFNNFYYNYRSLEYHLLLLYDNEIETTANRHSHEYIRSILHDKDSKMIEYVYSDSMAKRFRVVSIKDYFKNDIIGYIRKYGILKKDNLYKYPYVYQDNIMIIFRYLYGDTFYLSKRQIDNRFKKISLFNESDLYDALIERSIHKLNSNNHYTKIG